MEFRKTRLKVKIKQYRGLNSSMSGDKHHTIAKLNVSGFCYQAEKISRHHLAKPVLSIKNNCGYGLEVER